MSLTGALPLAATGADLCGDAAVWRPETRDADASLPRSFEAIYESYFDFVWRNVRRLGVAQAQADDAVQEVFLIVYRRRSDFVGGSFRAWIFAVVANVARDHRRMDRRKSTLLRTAQPNVDPDEIPGVDLPCDEVLARGQGIALMHGLLEGLDDDKRAVFVLAELEQMTAPEIAQALGANVNTVYARLRAARKELDQGAARLRARDERRLR